VVDGRPHRPAVYLERRDIPGESIVSADELFEVRRVDTDRRSVTSHDLKELALALAREGFEARVNTMIDAAAGDTRALSDAAMSLTSRSTKAGTAEHVAFTYLSAAFHQSLGFER
jgi:hypothetical protein